MSEDDIKLAIRDSIKFPLTARDKLAFNYRDKLNKEWENVEKCDVLKTQIKGIESIKKHIAHRKRQLFCHQNERFQSKIRHQQSTVDAVLNKHNVSLKNERIRKVIADKLLLYNKNQKMKMKKQKERMMSIIQKITNDYEWKEKQKIAKQSTWQPRLKKIIEPSIEEEVIVETEEEQEWEEIKEPKKKKDKKVHGKGDKKKKKEKKGKKGTKKKDKSKKGRGKKDKSKKSSDKKSKKSSESKKGKKRKDEFEMPFVPVTNPREKIKPDENQKMIDLLSPLQKYDNFVEEENEFYRDKEIIYPINKNCGSRPSALIFEEFENNQEYKQKLYIHNNSSEIIHCKYHRIICMDEFESTYILVEDVGIQKVLPGRCYPLMVYFFSRDLKYLEGELIFTTQKPGTSDIKQFSVPFRCQIATINIKVSPTNVIFKSLPIWEVPHANNNFKIIEVQNNMIQDCILVIRKIRKEDEYDSEKLKNEIRDSIKIRESNKKYNSEASLNTIEFLIAECIDKLSNIFYFSSYFYSLPPKSILHLKVYWKNAPFVGAHQEVFELEFLEKINNDFNVLHHQNILIQTEVTGKFIETDYEYLDYNICVINSVYQQPFNVYNYGTYPVKIGFQYPSKLKQYFSAFPSTFYLKPNNHENVSLRFIPRTEILSSQIKYFDPQTNILNCPIKIVTLSTKPSNIPPTIITLYAILTEPDNIKLRLTSLDKAEEDGCPVINMGQVTIQETVTADFEIENISPVTQEFAFLNLPPMLTLRPNYGFGSVEPNEIKKLDVCLSPNVFDMITDDFNHSTGPLDVSYKIFCTTTYKLGGVKQTKHELKKSMLKHADSLELKFNKDFENIDELFPPISEETNSDLTPDITPDIPKVLEEVEHWVQDEEQLEEEVKITKKLSLIIKATIVDYWTELSHQFIIFPDTPLGSYTTMDLLFSAVNYSSAAECVCGYIKKDKQINFDCHFEVTGGCPDITIEPICGDLKKGESVHLLLTAKPTVENHILLQTAKVFKVQRIISSKKRKKEKEQKKESSKKTARLLNDNISLHNCDFYPAEKEISKFMRPYTIKTKFTFLVTFPEHFKKENEILYLTVECKVIRPDFITNLPTQYINFGPTALHTRPKTIITLENISRRIIHPKVTPLNPLGPFICSTQIQNHLEKEHLLKIPITFAPTEELYFKEYFEIKSHNTSETLVVSGEGIAANYDFSPKFTVCRIEAKFGKSVDCVFQVNNKCRAPIVLYFKKLCELKGIIVPKPIVKETVKKTKRDKSKDKKGKKTDKSSKSSKKTERDKSKDKKGKTTDKSSKSSKKGKPGKPKDFSEELTPNEEYSLENFFEPYGEESQFKIMNAIDDSLTVEPMTKLKIKIRFEKPKPPPVDKTEKGKKGKKGKDKSTKSSKSSKSSKKKKEKGVKYIVKYNIMQGNIVLVKDIVIIAGFK